MYPKDDAEFVLHDDLDYDSYDAQKYNSIFKKFCFFISSL